jgi:hypothetical protein
VYCINHKSRSSVQKGMFQSDAVKQNNEHFLLLVITKEPCNIDSLNFQNRINQNNDIGATVILLLHSVKNVNEALLNNNRFFHEVLRSDQLIYQNNEASALIELPEYDNSKEVAKTDLVWWHRKKRAEALLEAAANMGEYETEVVELAVLSQAMEQICLGFLFAGIGYKPNRQSLKHLANICRCITPMFDEAFPISTADDEGVFGILIDSNNDARYRVPYNIDPTDVSLLHRRCSLWKEKAEELVSLGGTPL